MIKDFNKARELCCGHGTLGFCRDITNTKEVIYEKTFSKVGSIDNQYMDKDIKKCNVSCIILNFNGKDAIKSIDILIEDLNKIKEQLQECEG